jgi:hypothetical protein
MGGSGHGPIFLAVGVDSTRSRQIKARGAIGSPGIGGEVRVDELLDGMVGGLADSAQGNALISGRKCLEQFDRATEEARGRLEAAAVDAVGRFAVVMLQVHVGAGKLDEGFVKDIPFAIRAQPDVLENIVGFVIRLPVEEPEIFEVAGVPGRIAIPSGHLCSNPLVFTHGVCGSTNHRVRGADRAKNITDRLGSGGGSAMMEVL